MYLKTLILTGFKSFPEKIRLEFGTGVTAVVGPNGSGKSNISDAARWVLGEQSAKSLRGSKMEDIIFAGTENRRSLGFAEVSMVIDNADHRMKTEYSEITVTRRMYRSGEGEYRINGVTCRLKDIHELFMDTGVGREGYSIIGQGRIEEILSARSEDRRMLFEEAAGIIKYKSRRQDASVKLERERQNLLRVQDVIAELELHLPPLAEQAEKAKLYLNLKEQLKTVQVNIFLTQARSAEKQTAELNESIRVMNAQREAERAKHENQNRIYERLRSDAADTDERLRLLDGERESLRSRAERTEVNIKVAEERQSNMMKAEERLNAQINKNNAQADRKYQTLAAERERGAAAELESAALRERLEAAQKAFDSFSEGLTERDQTLERLNISLMDRMKASLDLKNKIERAENQIETLAERKDAMTTEGEACDRRIVEVNALLNRERAEAGETVRRMDALLARIQEIQKHAAVLNDQSEQSSLKEAEAVRKLGEAESRHTVLSEMERGFEGYRRGSKAVLKRGREITGIHGAVGELARTPEYLETAVETALGSSLHDIVTETDADAIAAIEYLKSAKEGRATFLPLNTVKPRSLNKDKDRLLAEPGVIGIASALISHDPIYEGIFMHLLGAVIIADNSGNAAKISKKYKQGHMIVTLDGEVFSPGGAITGGGSNTRGGLISRTRELDELKGTIVELRARAEDYRRESADIKARISAEADELETARGEWQALLLENNTQRNRCGQLEETNLELNKKFSDITEGIERLSVKENEALNALTPLQAEVNAAEREIKAIRLELDSHSRSASGDRQKHDEQVRALTDLKIQAGGLEQTLRANKETAGRIESEIKAMLADNETLERDLSASRTERRKLAESMESMKSDLAAETARLAELADQIEAAANNRDELRERIAETERKQRTGTETLASLDNEVLRLEMRREQIETDTRGLYDDMWDEYQLTAQTAKDVKTLDLTPHQMNREERRLKNEISGIGDVNVGAIEEYKTINGRYEFLANQRSDILAAEQKLLSVIDELTGLMEKQFAAQFELISQNFSLVFREMFSGGKARLVMSDANNILESGIEIEAQPPGKNLQSMSLLSGGERALTAAALLFGILRLKPSPFCILDEIEAALDEANVNRFAAYIRKISGDTQFILITHRKGTMEAADVLYGVTMQEAGVSKLVSVRLEEASA
ncbi:MAG: chromosome segregation protein SMC [Clostridiales bacterium]|jgi:chromosome segregation protein|nr:chromosome segregation protein SMC [Clostridiales bacterium]